MDGLKYTLAMAHSVRFRWPQLDVTVQVRLLDDYNPELTHALWEQLPLLSIQSHAIVAGQQIYAPTRLSLADLDRAYTEPMNEQPSGRINFEPYFQYLALNYGPMSEPVPAWPIGQVATDDLARLSALGQQVWSAFQAGRTDLLLVVERADEPPTPLDLARLAAPHRAAVELPHEMAWSDLLHYIEAETDAIWVNEPQDVLALRLGVQTSEAGVYGQYFSPWVMVTGLVRSLAIVDVAVLVRLARDETFTVAHLQRLVHEMLAVMLGVVSYFGLPQLGATLAAVDRTVDQIEEREDFSRFIRALHTYVNRYNLWLYQTFPWRLGVLFPKTNGMDAQTVLDLLSRPPYHHEEVV